MEKQRVVRGERAMFDKVGLKRTAIEELMERGDFPKPIRLGKRAKGWLEHELDDWLRSRAAERKS